MTRFRILLLLTGFAFPWFALRGEEPAMDMLEELRESQYFDIALIYLDRLEKGEIPAGDKMKSEILLERATTLQKAAIASRTAKDRDTYLDQSEVAVRKFLETQASSERADEARSQLAALLLVRGVRLGEKSKDNEENLKKAKQLLESAVKSYDEIVEKLRERLKGMQGEKAANPAQIALRDSYRAQFLSAILSSGTSRQQLAKLYPDKDPTQTKLLEEALKAFNDLSDKYSDKIQGALGMHYRGVVQEALGKSKEALESHTRMLEFPDVDLLRSAQVQSLTSAIKLWLASDPPRYKEAVDKGLSWVNRMTPEEKSDPLWQNLSLHTAKAFLEQAKALEKEKAGATKVNGAKREAKRLLVSAAKVPGDHQEEAAKLLGELGVDVGEVDDAPPADIKSFADAMQRGRELLEASEGQALPLQMLAEQLAKDPQNADLAKQKEQLEETLATQRSQAIEVFQLASRLATSENTIEDINQTRYFMAHMLLRQKRYRECLVVSNFLCRRFPSSELAPQWGTLAVNAYQGILAENPENPDPTVLTGLQELSGYLLERWPNEPAAGIAAEILVRVSLSQGEIAKADQYLKKVPEGSAQRVSLQQVIGQFQWNEYLKAAAEEMPVEANVNAALQTAATSLANGLKGLTEAQADTASLVSALLLAKAHLIKDEPKLSIAALDNPIYGPLKRLEGPKAIAPPDENFVSSVYRTALQTLVSLATGDQADPKALERAETIIDKLKESMKGHADAEKRLVSTYYQLAKEIRAQLSTAQPAKRQQLVEAFSLLLSKLAQTTGDVSTLHWIGQTFVELAGSLEPGDGPVAGKAKELLAAASTAFKKAIETGAGDLETQIRYEYAKASRLQGEYREAIAQLEIILAKKATMLDAQMEGAKAFQQWADSGSEKLYLLAMNGFAGKGGKPGQNVIWGWGKLSLITNGKAQFRDIFFESRFRLNECQLGYAKKEKDAAKSKKAAEQALKDISGLAVRYPDMGGPALFTRYDQLMKDVQTFLGQNPVGLPAPQAPKAPEAPEAPEAAAAPAPVAAR